MSDQDYNLGQKLVAIRESVNYLQKENQGHQYSYVSSSQALSAFRNKMNELGVLLIPEVTDVRVGPLPQGGKQFMTELEMTFTWLDAETGDTLGPLGWYGQGCDNAEKGVGKALTYAEKYFLLKFFNVPTDRDDPDRFQEKNGNGQSGNRQRQERSNSSQPPPDDEPRWTKEEAEKAQELGEALSQLCGNDMEKMKGRLNVWTGKRSIKALQPHQIEEALKRAKAALDAGEYDDDIPF